MNSPLSVRLSVTLGTQPTNIGCSARLSTASALAPIIGTTKSPLSSRIWASRPLHTILAFIQGSFILLLPRTYHSGHSPLPLFSTLLQLRPLLRLCLHLCPANLFTSASISMTSYFTLRMKQKKSYSNNCWPEKLKLISWMQSIIFSAQLLPDVITPTVTSLSSSPKLSLPNVWHIASRLTTWILFLT